MGLFDRWTKKSSETEEAAFPGKARREIEEALHFLIHSGFYSREDIFDEACGIAGDICADNNLPPPSKLQVRHLIERLFAGVKPDPQGKNNYVRLREVFDALNQERVIAIHFVGYTQNDGFDEVSKVFRFMKKNDIPRKGYCFYHQQDVERAMDASSQFILLSFYSMNDDKQVAIEIGERIVELLIEHGFEVEWNNSADTRIKIKNFLWDKVYDGEDYGADRAIRIMSQRKSFKLVYMSPLEANTSDELSYLKANT